ncbi:hypothetical protein CC80DRAFT_60556 [Byssothecium circinans]|uniref:Uncharacterized protein n=1 Tax=Byssothecium circinans TaxID=147558 RepID=A0A6A5TVV1_9PLEO|nr:hypothetical protein CC80DRAFT_60556 [Byssothecium circinans]
MDAHRQAPSTMRMSGTQEATGLRKALRRWRDRWRVSSSSSSRSSRLSPPTTRPPTHNSSDAPSLTPLRLSPNPGSPYPPPDALFTPTTSTFIHSPADPRNRPGGSNTSSPSGTLRKIPPLSRRNTAPTEFLNNIAASHFPPTTNNNNDEQPMGMVTTIVAGNSNDSLRKKRSSRFRLSISKRAPSPALNTSSSAPGLYERSSSRATHRPEAERSSSRATQRHDVVDERGGAGKSAVRKRADTKVSDPETLIEEGGHSDGPQNEGEGKTEKDDDKKKVPEKHNAESEPKALAKDAKKEQQVTAETVREDKAQSSIRLVQVGVTA